MTIKTNLTIISKFLLAILLCQNSFSTHHEAPSPEDVLIGYQTSADVTNQSHPFTIHVHYDASSWQEAPNTPKSAIESVLAYVTQYFKNHLFMNYKPKMHLNYSCEKSIYVNHRIKCIKNCKIPKCGFVNISENYLASCGSSAPTNREGPATEAHFILFVSVDKMGSKCDSGIISAAAHCQQGFRDRPIAGYIDFCSKNMLKLRSLKDKVTVEIIQQLMHMLAFSPSLYPFFHNKLGKPRTERLKKTRLPRKVNGRFFADSNTITNITREWRTASGNFPKNVTLLVTENVRKEVQNYFGCSNISGAQLEDGGGDQIALAHFEKRIFRDDFMVGEPVTFNNFSRLTLAVLEDTGWYIPDYSQVHETKFAKGLGCDFVNNSCLYYMEMKKLKQESILPYCDKPLLYKGEPFSETTCSEDRNYVISCNLYKHEKKIEPMYTYFNKFDGIDDEDPSYYGGKDPLEDYCPLVEPFQRPLKNGKKNISSCKNVLNDNEKLKTYEKFSSSSKCFNYGHLWRTDDCGVIRHINGTRSGCYSYYCADKSLYVGVPTTIGSNGFTYYWCPYKGARINIYRRDDNGLNIGQIICPKCSEICDNCVDQNVNGRFGDVKLDNCVSYKNDPKTIVYNEMVKIKKVYGTASSFSCLLSIVCTFIFFVLFEGRN